MKLRFRSL